MRYSRSVSPQHLQTLLCLSLSIQLLQTWLLLMMVSRHVLGTVEPPNKGHFGANSFVPCREVVSISEDPLSEVPLYSTGRVYTIQHAYTYSHNTYKLDADSR